MWVADTHEVHSWLFHSVSSVYCCKNGISLYFLSHHRYVIYKICRVGFCNWPLKLSIMIVRHTHIAALSILLWDYFNSTPLPILNPPPSFLPSFLRSLWCGLPASSYPLWQTKWGCPCLQHVVSSGSRYPSLNFAPEAAGGSNTLPHHSFFSLISLTMLVLTLLTFTALLASVAFFSQTLRITWVPAYPQGRIGVITLHPQRGMQWSWRCYMQQGPDTDIRSLLVWTH